ncbi:MAG: hypothetical protein CMO44_02655 [Verrucomicrobiales bacterium]|nr:hypothetical protein [Verrucomicrobiales bacterium]
MPKLTKRTKLTKRNKQRLDAEKDRLLQQRAVVQSFTVDDLEFPSALHRSMFTTLFGDGIQARTTAKHVKNYFDINNKRDKKLKKEDLILAQSDFTGKKDENYYELRRIQSLTCTDKKGVQANIAWRGKDKDGKKFTNSMIKLSMLKKEEVAQHHVEYATVASAIDQWSSRQAHLYTPVNDGYASK